MLYKEKYCINSNYSHDKRNLASLIEWYEHLEHEHYRYTFLSFVLRFNSDDNFNPMHITKLFKRIREVKIEGHVVPFHYIWRLEYGSKNGAFVNNTGYHYHVFLAWNREISPDSSLIVKRLRKHWKKQGDVYVVNTVQTPSKVNNEFIRRDAQGNDVIRPLLYPVMNTQTELKSSVFHHMSYLTKIDPDQALPDYSDTVIPTFGRSKRDKKKLTNEAHHLIKRRNNTIRLNPPIAA